LDRELVKTTGTPTTLVSGIADVDAVQRFDQITRPAFSPGVHATVMPR